MDFIIKKAGLADIPAIRQLEKECFSAPWTDKQIEFEICNENSFFVAAFSGGELCGYGSFKYAADTAYINNIAVGKEFRRQGLASDLLGVFFRFAQAQNLAFLTLEVRDSNLAARNLYRKFGFRDVGRRRNYYDKPTEDAILMTRFFREEGTAQ